MDIRHAVGVKRGIAPEKLAALPDHRESELFSPREQAALDLAEEMSGTATSVSDACRTRVAEHFTETERLELVFVIGYQTFASKFAKAYTLTPQGFATLAA